MNKYILLLFFLLLLMCNTTKEPIEVQPNYSHLLSIPAGLNPDYLKLNEMILMDFYGSEENKKQSIEALKKRCDGGSLTDPHSCYNVSVLLTVVDKFEEAIQFSQRAVQFKPDDPLYRDLYRQILLKTKKHESLKTTYPHEAEKIYQMTHAIDLCKSKNEIELLSVLRELVRSGEITKESIENGVFSDCLSKDSKKNLLSTAKANRVNYKIAYQNHKARMHPFSAVWDSNYYTKNSNLESESSFTKPLTQSWKDVKIAIRTGSFSLAQNKLQEFIKILREEKNQNRKHLHLYTAIERAAYFLVEQDKEFENFRSLIKEF